MLARYGSIFVIFVSWLLVGASSMVLLAVLGHTGFDIWVLGAVLLALGGYLATWAVLIWR